MWRREGMGVSRENVSKEAEVQAVVPFQFSSLREEASGPAHTRRKKGTVNGVSAQREEVRMENIHEVGTGIKDTEVRHRIEKRTRDMVLNEESVGHAQEIMVKVGKTGEDVMGMMVEEDAQDHMEKRDDTGLVQAQEGNPIIVDSGQDVRLEEVDPGDPGFRPAIYGSRPGTAEQLTTLRDDMQESGDSCVPETQFQNVS